VIHISNALLVLPLCANFFIGKKCGKSGANGNRQRSHSVGQTVPDHAMPSLL